MPQGATVKTLQVSLPPSYDGFPLRTFSGSLHYFRIHPLQWQDRLQRMRAAGLNTVSTYIPWNLHEPAKGKYEFEGFWNIVNFIRAVDQAGLRLIIRPGPYICAEWDFGGLPAWLLNDPHMQVRTSRYKPFLRHVEAYFSHLLPLLAKHTAGNGGPIIAFQLENEFGSHNWDKEKDVQYLLFLRDQFQRWGIQEELLFTANGDRQLPNGTLPDVLATLTFNKWPAYKLGKLRDFQPDRPLFASEFQIGWFDLWGGNHHVVPLSVFEEILDGIFQMNASVNFYVFVGGTTFGLWSGSLWSGKPYVTSYDFDAAVAEGGNITPKFHIIQKLIHKYSEKNHVLNVLPPVLPDPPKAAYGRVSIADNMPYKALVELLYSHENIGQAELDLVHVVTMERLKLGYGQGQNSGWLLYRTKIPSGHRLLFDGRVADRAQVILDGQEVAVVDVTNYSKPVDLSRFVHQGGTQDYQLDILVENQGRANIKLEYNDQQKGISWEVKLDDDVLVDWQHVPFQWDDKMIQAVMEYSNWEEFTVQHQNLTIQPRVYRLFFSIADTPKDTFIDMRGWKKGIVIVNGFNIGRYWDIGPQQSLYVPAPSLKQGRNTILIFELHQPGSAVMFTDHPALGPTEDMKVEAKKPPDNETSH